MFAGEPWKGRDGADEPWDAVMMCCEGQEHPVPSDGTEGRWQRIQMKMKNAQSVKD